MTLKKHIYLMMMVILCSGKGSFCDNSCKRFKDKIYKLNNIPTYTCISGNTALLSAFVVCTDSAIPYCQKDIDNEANPPAIASTEPSNVTSINVTSTELQNVTTSRESSNVTQTDSSSDVTHAMTAILMSSFLFVMSVVIGFVAVFCDYRKHNQRKGWLQDSVRNTKRESLPGIETIL